MEPADFYTGLVAELYAPLRSSSPDPVPYARFVDRSGTPALELGCGDGDPLLALRASGLDVEGLDSSADMLARCRRRADELGLDVVLHHATIEGMDLGRVYRSMYLAGATFCLLPDDDLATQALRRIADHLDPDGRVLIPLFVPPVVPHESFGRSVERVDTDGTLLRCTTVTVTRDEETRRQATLLRYERMRPDGGYEMLEREWLLHWYEQDGFADLAERAGLAVRRIVSPDGSRAAPTATECSFVLARA
jgi:SAM-dependent methyltransferase